MSNKSGTAEQVISLPQGGGALSGIGETFAPDLHTGTGNFTVPIALPPGRNGFQPQLSLVYSTGNGNGPFGMGWVLSIPGVSRKTSKGVPKYQDGDDELKNHDIFILSGAEDLVPITERDSEGVIHYRPRTEGLFARIAHQQNAAHDYWEVRSKDGLVSNYGTPDAAGDDSAVVADPDERRKVCSWMLSRTEDPFGNHILYDYVRDSDVDTLRSPALPPPGADQTEFHHWDELYLKQIRYVDYDSKGATEYLVSITFHYEERPDPFSNYRSGFEMRTRLRCTRIEVHTHAGPTRTVRRYHLIYLDQRSDLSNLPDLLPYNGVSLLSQVRVEGVDEDRPAGEQLEALPPLEFSYTQFDPASRRYQPLAAVNNFVPERSLAHPEYELVDLFGNGLPDVIQMNGLVRYWRNLGGGCFDFPRTMEDAPAAVDLADRGVQMADLDGDGHTDLLVTDGVRGGYYPLAFDGRWDTQGFRPYDRVPSINLEASDVRLIDLDGDGITDALRTGPSFELYFNDRYTGWLEVELRAREDQERFPNLNFDDPRVKLADLTGDDLQDFVLLHNGRIEYWPYMGYGRWGRRITMTNSPEFEDAAFFPGLGFDPKRVLLGDVDGDGLADLVYVGSEHITVWINRNGNGWSDPIEIDGSPPISNIDSVRLADMLGTGTAGILWTYDQNAQLDSTYKFLDLTGGLKPYLLGQMDNHMGARTSVTYASSTEFYRADAENPDTQWKTALPFPVLVVSRVVVEDYFSKGRLTTEYRYHDGYWDGAEREFRGFGRVEQLDAERFPTNLTGSPVRFTPPVLTRTWFHQGPVGPEFGEWREADTGDEYWPEDPSVLPRPAELVAFLQDPNIPRRVKRDAIRALRGVVLRTELYALDGSENQDRPYTVTESQCGVRPEALPQPGEAGRRPIFFPHPVAQRTTQWERGDDPMTQFSFTEDYDEFGQPQRQTQIACPRGWRALNDRPGRPYLATRSQTVYARPSNPDVYIMDRAASLTTFEIVNDGTQRVLELRGLAEDDPALKVFGQSLNFYDGLPFTGAALGEIQRFGALVRSESLVLTDEILAETYPPGDPTLAHDAPPPYFASAGAPAWPAGYPTEFAARYPTDQHSDRSRPGLNITPLNYGFAAGGAGSPFRKGYYVATARQSYDFHNDPSGQGRGLLLARRGPLGRDTPERDTVISYDAFDMLPVAVTGPVGLTTRAEYDYRVMQPRLVTGPNENQNEFRFSPLGLLQEIFVRGKTGAQEGDQGRASTCFEYDFLAFANSLPDKRLPIFVHTTKHEHHDTETDVTQPERDATLETVEYSDGFGRLLQTRTQAEDVLFGDAALDAPLFGNDVLPADQDDAAGTQAPVTGRQRGQHDPANVVVSGWQFYDNKGKVVEKFEPFFSKGFDYLSPDDEQARFGRDVLGQKVTMFYDPRGQVMRTVNPDGSEQRVIYGVPKALDTPDDFVPMPWETYTYDANDLAPLSQGPRPGGTSGSLADRAPQHHHFTPAHMVIDAMGRTLLAVERNRVDTASPIVEFTTRSSYDIRGNLLKVTDALGREAFRYSYNLANQPLRTDNIDAGLRRFVVDAAGNEIERRDSKGALILQAHDVLHRPIRLWARDDGDSPVSLRQRLEYGDGGDPDQSPADRATNRAANRLGRLYKHYDEAGLLTFEGYDFKGNLLEKTHQVISDQAILAAVDARPPGGPGPDFRVDWQPAHGDLTGLEADLLDPKEYRSSMAYDALNRVKRMVYPLDQDGQRKMLRPHYNRAGALERVELDGQVYVERIAYDAKGQRSLAALGNGVMTRYAHDPRTFRLLRLRSERYTQTNALTYQPGGGLLQDFAYDYDLVGDILAIHDRVLGSGVLPQPDALDRAFGYDAIYRLTSATGRECKNLSRPQPEDENPPWCGYNSGKHGTPNQDNAPNLTRSYREVYAYDAVGNLTRLRHQALESGNPGGFTRTFTLLDGSNRLQQVTIGNGSSIPPYEYTYDANGNLITETTSRHFEWDHSDRLKSFRIQAGASQSSVQAHYLYDAAGMRVKKLVRKQGGRIESTTYIDSLFERQRWQGNGQPGENNHLHVMDGQQRIALVRVGKAHPDDKGPAIQYHLGDHLGSSNLVVDPSGNFVNREEYAPYGETSLGSFARKRYRFTGKERDEESGLYYHGARYYVPWLGRWVSTDPSGMTDGVNLYSYVRNGPLSRIDPSGTDGRSKQENTSMTGPGVADSTSITGGLFEILKTTIVHKQNELLKKAEKARQVARKARLAKNRALKKQKKPTNKIKASEQAAEEARAAREDANTISKLREGSELIGHLFDALAFGAEVYDKAFGSGSPAQTRIGKITDAGMSATINTAFSISNPIAAALDAGQGLVFSGHKPLPISDTMKGSTSGITSVGEAIFTGNISGIASFHRRSKAGEWGWILQWPSVAADWLSEHGGGAERAITSGEFYQNLHIPFIGGVVARGAALIASVPVVGHLANYAGRAAGNLVVRLTSDKYTIKFWNTELWDKLTKPLF